MPQIILGIVAIALAAYAFLAMFGAFLAALAVAAIAGITALAVKWLPYEPETTRVWFVMTEDHSLRVQANRRMSPFTAAWRATPIVIASFVVPLAALSGRPPASGDVEAWIAYVGGLVGAFGAAIASSIGFSMWVNEGSEHGLVLETNDELDIVGLALLQHDVEDEGKALRYERDYLAEFGEWLRSCRVDRDGGHWAEIETHLVDLTAEAQADLTAIRNVATSLTRLDAARNAARIRLRNSGSAVDHELWPALEKWLDELSRQGFLPTGAETMVAAFDAIRGEYEKIAANARDPGHRTDSGPGNSRTHAGIPSEVVEAFAVLGLTPRNDLEAAKAAYRYYRGIHHPDKGGPAASPERFRRVQEAWECIQSWSRQGGQVP